MCNHVPGWNTFVLPSCCPVYVLQEGTEGKGNQPLASQAEGSPACEPT